MPARSSLDGSPTTHDDAQAKTYSDLEDALWNNARTYRRSVWDDQDVYVEIWLEKDALAGVLVDVTDLWDVPLMVTRGFASLSFLYEAADCIESQGKPAFLYYFGDHDPSGVDIPRTVKERSREFAPDAEITFERVAVNPDQIERRGLPSAPTKKTDSRSKNFRRRMGRGRCHRARGVAAPG